jgi:uncharacterized protein with von Willebrand factor type A (vWA) domain
MASDAGGPRGEMRAAVAAAVSPRLAELAARLRAAGVPCGIDELVTAHEALAEVAPTRAATRAALRCVLCRGPDDLAAFEVAFLATFGEPPPPPAPAPPLKPAELDARPEGRAVGGDGRPPPGAEDERRSGVARDALTQAGALVAEGEPLASPAQWSALELLREKDFRAYTASDRRVARTELRRLAAALPTRRSARRRPQHGDGERLDVARTLRVALRSGGDPLELRWRAPTRSPRRLVFVCDVSGSMAAYARLVLEYVHAVAQVGRGVETFCFATELARVTRELRGRDPEQAIARVEAHVPGRSGGTRIGAAIAQLNREHGRWIGRGAIVVVLSDGWDRGEPGLLADEMARLRRTSHRVLWLDPHRAGAGYEPLTRGMREALPHVDRLLPGHSLGALSQLADALAQLELWRLGDASRPGGSLAAVANGGQEEG